MIMRVWWKFLSWLGVIQCEMTPYQQAVARVLAECDASSPEDPLKVPLTRDPD